MLYKPFAFTVALVLFLLANGRPGQPKTFTFKDLEAREAASERENAGAAWTDSVKAGNLLEVITILKMQFLDQQNTPLGNSANWKSFEELFKEYGADGRLIEKWDKFKALLRVVQNIGEEISSATSKKEESKEQIVRVKGLDVFVSSLYEKKASIIRLLDNPVAFYEINEDTSAKEMVEEVYYSQKAEAMHSTYNYSFGILAQGESCINLLFNFNSPNWSAGEGAEHQRKSTLFLDNFWRDDIQQQGKNKRTMKLNGKYL